MWSESYTAPADQSSLQLGRLKQSWFGAAFLHQGISIISELRTFGSSPSKSYVVVNVSVPDDSLF